MLWIWKAGWYDPLKRGDRIKELNWILLKKVEGCKNKKTTWTIVAVDITTADLLSKILDLIQDWPEDGVRVRNGNRKRDLIWRDQRINRLDPKKHRKVPNGNTDSCRCPLSLWRRNLQLSQKLSSVTSEGSHISSHISGERPTYIFFFVSGPLICNLPVFKAWNKLS